MNSVTQPGQATWCSNYFIDRWMPILGNDGTRIVLALRRHGYNNRRTGVKREEIKIDREGLAAIVGCSGDTITRELGTNKKTGKLQNPWLHEFVRKFEHKRTDARTGQIRQEVNGYWVAMDDPIHPDDWHLVAEYVLEQEAVKEKGQTPGGQNASPAPMPKTQNASPVPQSASKPTQNASDGTQNASRNNESIPDSYLPLETPITPVAPGDSLSLFEDEDQAAPSAEEIAAVRAAIAVPPEPPKKLTSKDIEADWGALPPEERQRYRAPAVAQIQAKGTEAPTDRMIEPVMFRLYWAERKGVEPLKSRFGVSEETDDPRADLARALDAVKAAQEHPDGTIRAALREMSGRVMPEERARTEEWRSALWAAQIKIVPFVDACFAAGMTLAEMNGRLAIIGAEVKRPGKTLMISFRGGSGDFLTTRPMNGWE